MTRTKWLKIACIRRQQFIAVRIEELFSYMPKGQARILNLKVLTAKQ
jgi:hypothetical protein